MKKNEEQAKAAMANSTSVTAPAAAFAPCAVTFNSMVYNLYVDTNSHISAIIVDPSNPTATPQYMDLTNTVSAPVAAGAPCATLYIKSQLHIFYRDVNNNISDILYSSDGQGWLYQNLNQLTSGAPLAAGDPQLTITDNETQKHIVYLAQPTNGNYGIADIWYDSDNYGQWNYTNVTNLSPITDYPNSPQLNGNPCMVIFGSQTHYIYLDSSNYISDIYTLDGSTWNFKSISTGSTPTSNIEAAVIGSSLYILYDNGAVQPSVQYTTDGVTWQAPSSSQNFPSGPHMQNNPCPIIYQAPGAANPLMYYIFRTGANDNNLMYYTCDTNGNWTYVSPITRSGCALVANTPGAAVSGSFFQITYVSLPDSNVSSICSFYSYDGSSTGWQYLDLSTMAQGS